MLEQGFSNMNCEKIQVKTFFGDPTGEGGILCWMKREELLFRDQHHSEEYSLDLVPIFVDRAKSIWEPLC